jgi:MFS superfamily sulfate permease-like transporter
MTVKQVISKLLLAFVLVSIGFALGRETALRSARASAPSPDAAGSGAQAQDKQAQPTTNAPAAEKVLVYYLHATVRCITCNTIERLTRETLQQDFAKELADGRVTWQTANFQERDDLARKYDVTGSTVLVVTVKDGKETRFERLDKVWELVSEPEALSKYVGDAVRGSLQSAPAGGTR